MVGLNVQEDAIFVPLNLPPTTLPAHWVGLFPGAAQLLLLVWLRLPEAENPEGSLQLQANTGVEVRASKVGAATKPPRSKRRRPPEETRPTAGLTFPEAGLDGCWSSILFTFLPLFQCGACGMLTGRQLGCSPCPSHEHQVSQTACTVALLPDRLHLDRIVEEAVPRIDDGGALNSGGRRGFYSQNRGLQCCVSV